MKKTVYIFSIISLGFLMSVKAQELNIPTFTQYLGENNAVISPAYAGIGDNIKIRLNGLTQWVGIRNAPQNQSLAIDGRLGQRSGLGGFLYNDKNGNTYQKGLKAFFAHHLILDYYKSEYLSFGISYVLNQFEIDISQFDNIFDPVVTDNRGLSNSNFDVGFLYRREGFSLSLNAMNILNKDTRKFIFNEPNILRNYTAFASYVIGSKYNKDIEIEPSAFFQYFESDQRSSTDLNLKVRFMDFEDYYWAGISYRFLNDQLMNPLYIGPMGGLKKNNLYFAYSYLLTTNEIFGFNYGTHVVTIGIDIFQGLSNCPCTERYIK